jgi:hypothetical protein
MDLTRIENATARRDRQLAHERPSLNLPGTGTSNLPRATPGAASWRDIMRASSLLACLLFACSSFTAACSSSSGSGNDGDPGTPVKQQPLAGTIDGHAFSAKTAVAQPNGSGGMMVTVFSSAATCAHQPQLQNDGDVQVLLEVDSWKAGNAYELSLSSSVTFVEQKSGSPDNLITTTGRVEVTDPGSASANGTLSIRATSADFGSIEIEGQVPVVVCSQ